MFADCIKGFIQYNIHVYVVALYVIRSLNSSTSNGFFQAESNSNNFTRFDVYIDEDNSWETKLRILFHECGHAAFLQSIGPIEAERRRADDLQWLTDTEYHAISKELELSKDMFSQGDHSFLQGTVEVIRSRQASYSKGYSEAVEKIMTETLWQECIGLTGNRAL